LGVEIVGPRSVGATDHAAFDSVGIPGFQFIQERLEYNSRTHHSNMDFVDRIQREDLVQQATVAAVFAWYTANWPEKLPRKAIAPRSGSAQ
ncbi:MAG: M20/M25/M40 family metallo-hydrolase, partial [Vicinamibacterales bacterium]